MMTYFEGVERRTQKLRLNVIPNEGGKGKAENVFARKARKNIGGKICP